MLHHPRFQGQEHTPISVRFIQTDFEEGDGPLYEPYYDGGAFHATASGGVERRAADHIEFGDGTWIALAQDIGTCDESYEDFELTLNEHAEAIGEISCLGRM